MTTAESPIKKPVAVARAVGLLYLSIAISVVAFIREWSAFKDSVFKEADPFVMFLFSLFGWLFFAWLIYKIDEGRNWARIIFLVLFFLGVPFFIRGFLLLSSYSVVLDGLGLGQEILKICAVILLLGCDASPWFRTAKADPLTATAGVSTQPEPPKLPMS